MAHGYTMVTGRPQVVMVHVIVGAANALVGIINAARCHVPMLFTAGRNPLTEFGMRGSRDRQIHWAQESFDQGGMMREWVKWDYELRNFVQLETVVDRALAITPGRAAGPGVPDAAARGPGRAPGAPRVRRGEPGAPARRDGRRPGASCSAPRASSRKRAIR